MISKPAFIQGTFNFRGEGFDKPIDLYNASYTVPRQATAAAETPTNMVLEVRV